MSACPGSARPPAPAPGRLAEHERAATLGAIAAAQHRSGFIPRAAGCHGDPWNHLEAAMALVSGGRLEDADRALGWSLRTQRDDGSWPAELGPAGEPVTARIDTNCVAYLAVAAWHRYLATRDEASAAELLPAVERALRLVLSCQTITGEVRWELDALGRPGRYALVAASCSVHQSLLAAASLAAAVGGERPHLVAAARRLRRAIGEHLDGTRPGCFAPKDEFAMDWYYPVLAGVLDGDGAVRRLAEGTGCFVAEGRGVRCRRDERWVTTAETAECALAHGRAGDREAAARLLGWTAQQRRPDGGYATGLVHPERSEFPPGERSTYSAAAVLLADDALRGGAAAATFGWATAGEDLDAALAAR
jgi:hypothetical protein